MGSTEKDVYEPPADFEEVKSDPLIDINLSDSTEIWLIQHPKIQGFLNDFNGQDVTLKLHRDGDLGSFVASNGKSYDVVKAPELDPEVAVFLSSDKGSKIVGKISRRVSLVHYPDPSELQQEESLIMKQKAERAVELLVTSSKNDSSKSSRAMSSYKSSMPSSRTKSSGSGLASKTPNRRLVEETKKVQSVGDSGKKSGVTDEDSPHIKQKKKQKI